MANIYTLGIAVFAAIGTFLFVRHSYTPPLEGWTLTFQGL